MKKERVGTYQSQSGMFLFTILTVLEMKKEMRICYALY